MSYLVLARKWRPQTFEEVVGQEVVVKTLKNAILKGRIAQAYLFSGPRGVGKTSTARILAKALNCAEGPTPYPCNRCQSCNDITSGTSLDVIEIDGASHTGVDNIRELKEAVSYKPMRSRYKVYIIDEVHMLSQSAFNALLKTLEEPPSHVVFIFATTEPHKVPLTVLSRCQRFEFRRIPTELIFEHLKKIAEAEGIFIDQKALKLLAEKADGSLRDAQSLLDQVAAYAGGEKISEEMVKEVLGIPERWMLEKLAQSLGRGDLKEGFKIIEGLHEKGIPYDEFILEFMRYLRDLLLEGNGGFDPFQLRFWLQLCLRAESQMRKGDLDRLILEVTLMEMAQWRDLISVKELLERFGEKPDLRLEEVKTTEIKLQEEKGEKREEKPVVEEKTRHEEVSHFKFDFDWEAFQKEVSAESPIIGAFLAQTKYLGHEDGRLRIGVPSGFLLERLLEREVKERILKVLRSLWGGRGEVQFVLLEDQAPPKKAKDQDVSSFLREVLQVLGGEVIEERIN
jgi:DNA polymerase III subunit gamma/tau